MGQDARREHLIGATCAILSAAGFAGKAIFIKAAYAKGRMDAPTLIALRMIFSAPFFGVMAWRAARNPSLEPLTRREWGWLAGLAFLGYYLSAFLDFWGLEYISPPLERLILFTYPAWVLILSAIWFGRRISSRDVIALALSLGGIGLTFAHDLRLTAASGAVWKGSMLILAASFVYSFYLLGSPNVLRRAGSERFTGYVVLISSVYVMGHFFAVKPASALVQPSSVYWLSLALAVVSTVLPVILLVQAMQRVSATTVAICSSIGPILTILMSGYFLGEPVTAWQLGGAALVLSGVGLITHPPAQSEA